MQNNLKKVKSCTILWVAKKGNYRDWKVECWNRRLESMLEYFYEGNPGVFFPTKQKMHIMDLAIKKSKTLQEEEVSIRLKCRSIWIQKGYDNSKLFHNYAKHRNDTIFLW